MTSPVYEGLEFHASETRAIYGYYARLLYTVTIYCYYMKDWSSTRERRMQAEGRSVKFGVTCQEANDKVGEAEVEAATRMMRGGPALQLLLLQLEIPFEPMRQAIQAGASALGPVGLPAGPAARDSSRQLGTRPNDPGMCRAPAWHGSCSPAPFGPAAQQRTQVHVLKESVTTVSGSEGE